MDNRDALLEAGLRCIQKKGYGRTTARDLVAESGTNLGAIGYHFGSKEQLLNQAIGLGLERWVEELAEVAATASDGGPDAPLRRLADEVPASFARNRQLAVAWVEALAQAERTPDVRRQLAISYDTIRTTLASLIEAQLGAAAAVHARAAASAMIATFDGLLVQWLLDPDQVPAGREVLDAIAAAQAAARKVGAVDA